MNWKGIYHTLDPFDEELQEEVTRWIAAGEHIPIQRELDEVAELAQTYSMYGDELGWELTEKILSSYPGIYVYVLARDCVVVYWAGDTRMHALIKACTVADLPGLMVCNDPQIRELAQKKFEALKVYETVTSV